MLPEAGEDFSGSYEEWEEPSATWRLMDGQKRVAGVTDGREAVRQAVYCILNTERYESPIYSWDYGVELMDLYGEPLGFVLPELERRITEALTQDDRVEAVEDFVFGTGRKGIVAASFTVRSVFGKIREEKEVEV